MEGGLGSKDPGELFQADTVQCLITDRHTLFGADTQGAEENRRPRCVRR